MAGVLVVSSLTVAIGVGAATTSWMQQTPAVSPTARYFAAMATDRNDNVVLFGGNGATLAMGDTWLWDGTVWTQRVLAAVPPARAAAVAARDKNGDVVLFGGISYSPTVQFYNDTWLWNGTMWSQASPSTSPPARAGAAMAVDGQGTVVLFGGGNLAGNLNDTWVWDGSTWSQALPATSPPPRTNMTMATDANGNIVLFGGYDRTSLDDTWVWNGSTWTQASAVSHPSARAGAAMAAAANGNVVLFGGSAGSGYPADTWIWDGSTWSQAPPAASPSGRTNAAMTTDANGTIVLFGGNGWMVGALGDTWLLRLVSDTAPPVITVPADLTVPAVSAAGATVTYQVTATDDVDGEVPASCTPPSGSVFPIGITTVRCSATDDAGNTATAMFKVTVNGASDQLASLWDEVQAVGPGTSLADKVSAAQAALAAGKPRLAREMLTAFINQVDAQSGKSIDTKTAGMLIAEATRISSVLDS